MSQKRTIITIDEVDWPIDATLSIGYSASSNSTTHPVERSGSDGLSEISDHIELPPLEISIEGIMSEVPLNGNIIDAITGTAQPAQQWAFVEALLLAREQRKLVSLDAGQRGNWDNLVVSFDPQWTVSDGYSVQFSMKLNQIELVQSRVQFSPSPAATVALSVLQMFSDPVSVVSNSVPATGAQGSLITNAGTFPGITPGVDFVAGR